MPAVWKEPGLPAAERDHTRPRRCWADRGGVLRPERSARILAEPASPNLNGPALDGAVGWLDREIEAGHEAGDHSIVVERVLAIGANPSVSLLIFHRGRFGTV